MSNPVFSPEEKYVVQHYETNHTRTENGRFIVPLPKKSGAGVIGESRTQAVRQSLSIERSLHLKKQFADFDVVMRDYIDKGHAEPLLTRTSHPRMYSTFLCMLFRRSPAQPQSFELSLMRHPNHPQVFH